MSKLHMSLGDVEELACQALQSAGAAASLAPKVLARQGLRGLLLR